MGGSHVRESIKQYKNTCTLSVTSRATHHSARQSRLRAQTILHLGYLKENLNLLFKSFLSGAVLMPISGVGGKCVKTHLDSENVTSQ